MNTEQAWAGPLRLVSQAVIYVRLSRSPRCLHMFDSHITMRSCLSGHVSPKSTNTVLQQQSDDVTVTLPGYVRQPDNFTSS